MFEKIRKRDGRVVDFDPLKIKSAIVKAGEATDEFAKKEAAGLTDQVLNLAHESGLDPLPDVEGIQDVVEKVLMGAPFYKTAKAYILYREQHSQIRVIADGANVELVDGYLWKRDWKIPVKPNKKPHLASWASYQKKPASRASIKKWWKIWPDANPATRERNLTQEIRDLIMTTNGNICLQLPTFDNTRRKKEGAGHLGPNGKRRFTGAFKHSSRSLH